MDKRIGNQFWKLRSKHGRNKLFETPQLMWEAACEYFEWADSHPWLKTETTTGDKSSEKVVPTERPYTINALTFYLNCNVQYFSDFKKGLPEDEKDFSLVISDIENIIYNQKFEGAAVGAFNANIIARDLGLKERTDVTTGEKPIDLIQVEFVNYEKKE